MATDRVIASAPTSSRFKVTAVGDVGAGGSDLLGLNSSGRTTTTNVTVDGVTYTVTLTDTGGMEELDRLQPAVYRDTNCFLLCYSENSRESLENIESKWWPEVRSVGPSVPVVLVACHGDGGTVSSLEGQKLQNKLGATSHALYNPGTLEPVLVEAIRAARSHTPKKQPVQSESAYLDDGDGESSGSCCSCIKLPCFKGKDSSYSFQ